MKLSAPNRRFIREVERLTGVKLTFEHSGTNHRRLVLPDGRYVIASLTGDNNAARAAARDVRRLIQENRA